MYGSGYLNGLAANKIEYHPLCEQENILMIHRDIRPFTYLFCCECGSVHSMDFCEYDGTYDCEECYREIQYLEVDRKDVFFHTAKFLRFLRQADSSRVKRLILLYMRACGCTDEQAYDSKQIDAYCANPRSLFSTHPFEQA